MRALSPARRDCPDYYDRQRSVGDASDDIGHVVLAEIYNGEPHDHRPAIEQRPQDSVPLPRGGCGHNREPCVQRRERGVEVVIVVGIEPDQAGREAASLYRFFDHMADC